MLFTGTICPLDTNDFSNFIHHQFLFKNLSVIWGMLPERKGWKLSSSVRCNVTPLRTLNGQVKRVGVAHILRNKTWSLTRLLIAVFVHYTSVSLDLQNIFFIWAILEFQEGMGHNSLFIVLCCRFLTFSNFSLQTKCWAKSNPVLNPWSPCECLWYITSKKDYKNRSNNPFSKPNFVPQSALQGA